MPPPLATRSSPGTWTSEVLRLGIDFGGTGIKGAVVDLATGELESDRPRIPTPQPSTPADVAETIEAVVAEAHNVVACRSAHDGHVGAKLSIAAGDQYTHGANTTATRSLQAP